ncbi:TonB-dependent receptor [Pelagicoccus enzymogenes]|uniref:TonB-dependent receptor n=1 Tax=Pelagicoccus enzymogenes TaxID=2773457 RepID=UPI00280CEE5D|nr:TonB-dependent receptor [Pelagicoccus enzymogenes]MDQ8196989.1 TonB-dependent receptor [Pelagicoccus enzymogenes]
MSVPITNCFQRPGASWSLFRSLACFAALCCLGSASDGASKEEGEESLDLQDLSLEELLQLSVSNSAVRGLDLEGVSLAENPHERSIFETPYSVEVIGRETIEMRGLKDVAETVSSMVGVLSGESPGEPYSFSMRGFSRGSVAVLYDGVSIGSSILDMRPMSTNNLERLEIVKGPVQLQHGEGAAAGTVNIVSKRPKINSRPFGQAIVSYGSFDSSSLNLGYNAPLDDKAAYRIDVSRNASDGWVDDTDSHSLSLNGSVLWKPAVALELLLSVKYLDDSLPAYWGTPLVPREDALEPFAGIGELEGERVVDLATRFNNYNVDDREISSESLWTKLDANWSLGSATAMTFSIYRFGADRRWRNAEFYSYDPEAALVERDRLAVDHDRGIRGAQYQFSHRGYVGDWENALALKIDYSSSDFDRWVGFDIDGPFGYVDRVDLLAPMGGDFGSVPQRMDSHDIEMLALVLSDRIDLSDALSIDLAWRQERLDFANRRFEFSGAPRERAFLDRSFDQSSYRAGFSYRLSERFSGYGHYAFRHDPVRDDLSFFYDADSFSPSDLEQWELGFKALFNGDRTELTFAYFDIEKTVGGQIGPEAAIGLNERWSRGVELATWAQLSDHFTIGGDLSYTRSEFGDYVDPIFGVDVNGKRSTNAPELLGSLWASYDGVAGIPLELGGGISYAADRFADAANTVTLSEYTTVKLFASYSIGSNYRVSFHVRNLTDEIYARWSDINYPNQVSLDAPRSYELNIQYRF